MESEKLNKKNLELINQVIADKREVLNQTIAIMFIISGCVFIGTSLLQIALDRVLGYDGSIRIRSCASLFICFMIIMSYSKGKMKNKTYFDKVIIALWMGMASILLVSNLFFYMIDSSYAYLIHVLVWGVGMYITEIIMGNKNMAAITSLPTTLVYILFLRWGGDNLRFWDSINQDNMYVLDILLIIAALFSFIIPGILFYFKSKETDHYGR